MDNDAALKLFIAEDNAAETESLKNLLVTWSVQTGVEIRIEVWRTLSFEEECLAAACSASAIVLDIESPEMNGIEFAKRIRRRTGRPVIAYLTNRSADASEGYEMLASAYLVKPVSQHQINTLLNSVKSEWQFKKDSTLSFSYRKENYLFPVENIIYLESQGHSCKLVSLDGEYRVSAQLKAIVPDKSPACSTLIRCHKSFVVNITHIRKFGAAALTMSNGEVIPIGRSYSAAVKENILNCLSTAEER